MILNRINSLSKNFITTSSTLVFDHGIDLDHQCQLAYISCQSLIRRKFRNPFTTTLHFRALMTTDTKGVWVQVGNFLYMTSNDDFISKSTLNLSIQCYRYS